LTQANVSATRTPIWFNNAGGLNRFMECRTEGVNGAIVKVDSGTVIVSGNVVGLGYAAAGSGTITSYLSETDGGFSYGNRVHFRTSSGVADTGPEFAAYHSGDLVQRAWTVVAGKIAIRGMFMQTSGSSTEEYSGTGRIFKDYICINSYATGVYVDTTFHKNLEIRWDAFSGRTGRLSIVAYDSMGAIITRTRAVYFQSAGEVANYGYRYTQQADTLSRVNLRVDSTVKKIKVLFGPGTNPGYLRSFQITGFICEPTSLANPSQLAVWGGPVASDQILATTIPSTALGSGYSSRGAVVYNGNAAGGGATAGGWQCTAAGWNALAWAPSTVVLVNELRSNTSGANTYTYVCVNPRWMPSTVVSVNDWRTNGDNTYLCTTAGTTAASGGPTGTGTVIADNTAVWDYIPVPTPSWKSITGVSVNDLRSNDGKMYLCTTAGTTAASGGPTGTGTGITDGSAVWNYIAVPTFTTAASGGPTTTGTNITDNTATWDYVGFPVTTPARWTALPNNP
jgi:hypothetical protein